MKPVHPQSKYYAIIPAAGESQRMGRSKLLLPWPSRDPRVSTVIDAVLATWASTSVASVSVVVRENDEALIRACRRWSVSVVPCEGSTDDMKSSIQFAVRHLNETHRLTPSDYFVIAPADLPALRRVVIDRLLQFADKGSNAPVIVPHFGDRQGHPVLLSNAIANQLTLLKPNEGIDALLRRYVSRSVPFAPALRPQDIDTPLEYRVAYQLAVDSLNRDNADRSGMASE